MRYINIRKLWDALYLTYYGLTGSDRIGFEIDGHKIQIEEVN